MDEPRAPGVTWVWWSAGAVAATTLLYLVTLGWHAQRDRTEAGTCAGTGPHEPWQVATLAIGLGIIVAVATWRRHGPAVAAACTIAVTVVFSVDAATVNDPCIVGANLWPVGAVYLGLGAGLGLGLVVVAGELIRSVIRSRHS